MPDRPTSFAAAATGGRAQARRWSLARLFGSVAMANLQFMATNLSFANKPTLIIFSAIAAAYSVLLTGLIWTLTVEKARWRATQLEFLAAAAAKSHMDAHGWPCQVGLPRPGCPVAPDADHPDAQPCEGDLLRCVTPTWFIPLAWVLAGATTVLSVIALVFAVVYPLETPVVTVCCAIAGALAIALTQVSVISEVRVAHAAVRYMAKEVEPEQPGGHAGAGARKCTSPAAV